jgi:spore germination cell wall hydrolase CwlJ-like protein
MFKKIAFSVFLGISFIYFITANREYDMPLKVYYSKLSADAKKEVECLTDNIFFEAAYEPEKGKKAVAFVTLNRVYSEFYPKTICDVVKQKTTRVCQFSWYCQEKEKRLSYTKELTENQRMMYNRIRELAVHIYANYGKIDDPTRGALFYHADYVNPKWSGVVHTETIGRHKFYTRKDML